MSSQAGRGGSWVGGGELSRVPVSNNAAVTAKSGNGRGNARFGAALEIDELVEP